MDYKLAIFDIDGTITEIKPEIKEKNPKAHTPNTLGEQQPKENVIALLEELQANEVGIALATNRGGVAWGYNTLEEAYEMAEEAAVLCGVEGSAVYVCPYHAKAKGFFKADPRYAMDSDCRKPNPGMLIKAMEDAGVGPEETIFVGDMETDMRAAENAVVLFYWAKDYFGWE